MKVVSSKIQRGFTLLETVIAIGVLAVLLTTFMTVFGPAAGGIRRAINVQEADRLAFTLENELTRLRGTEGGNIKTGFDKAFYWIEESNEADNVLYVYQYRGNPNKLRTDGSYDVYTDHLGVAGKEYIVQGMMRRRSDPMFLEDLEALEGRVFAVKLTQLVFNNGEMTPGTPGQIADPKGGNGVSKPDDYPEGAIAFMAEFYTPTTVAANYLKAGGAFDMNKMKDPMFTRNMAVRR